MCVFFPGLHVCPSLNVLFCVSHEVRVFPPPSSSPSDRMTFPRTLSLHQGHPHDRKGEVEIGLHAVLIPQEEVTAVDVEMLACQWTATCQSILCWIDRGAQIPTTASTWGAWMRVPSSPPTTPAQTPLGTTAPDEGDETPPPSLAHQFYFPLCVYIRALLPVVPKSLCISSFACFPWALETLSKFSLACSLISLDCVCGAFPVCLFSASASMSLPSWGFVRRPFQHPCLMFSCCFALCLCVCVCVCWFSFLNFTLTW